MPLSICGLKQDTSTVGATQINPAVVCKRVAARCLHTMCRHPDGLVRACIFVSLKQLPQPLSLVSSIHPCLVGYQSYRRGSLGSGPQSGRHRSIWDKATGSHAPCFRSVLEGDLAYGSAPHHHRTTSHGSVHHISLQLQLPWACYWRTGCFKSDPEHVGRGGSFPCNETSRRASTISSTG